MNTAAKPASLLWYAIGVLGGMCFLGSVILVFTVDTEQILHDMNVSPSLARGEAEDLFAATRDSCENDYNLTAVRISGPRIDGGLGMERKDLSGNFYVLADVVIRLKDGRKRVVAVPRNGFYPVLHCTFRNADDFEITVAQPAGIESSKD